MLTVTESGFSEVRSIAVSGFTANEQGWGMMVSVIEICDGRRVEGIDSSRAAGR